MTTPTSPITHLKSLGQSVWLDNLSRSLLTSGELEHLRSLGVSGITSNPTIFAKVVSSSHDYNAAITDLRARDQSAVDILWDLMVADIILAADFFRPTYNATHGQDGFVSIEVSPDIAYDSIATITMADELHTRCLRPNVLVKIPATKEGLAAIEDQIAKGHSINVTLIFSLERYRAVVQAFQSGLQKAHASGLDLSTIVSVASFFVSRIDTKVDALLHAQINKAADANRERLTSMLGQTGIANSRLAYEDFKQLHTTALWQALVQNGAQPQRCLWASTSTKSPAYRDTMYVEELIGPHTINTMPESTFFAFLDHGLVRSSLEEDLLGARSHLEALADLAIDLPSITAELESEGVANFAASYHSLLQTISSAAR